MSIAQNPGPDLSEPGGMSTSIIAIPDTRTLLIGRIDSGRDWYDAYGNGHGDTTYSTVWVPTGYVNTNTQTFSADYAGGWSMSGPFLNATFTWAPKPGDGNSVLGLYDAPVGKFQQDAFGNWYGSPDSPYVRAEVGSFTYDDPYSGNTKKVYALKLMRMAVVSAPKSVLCLVTLAFALTGDDALGDHSVLPEAERCLKQVIKVDPSNSFAHDELGWVYTRLGDDASAKREDQIADSLRNGK